MMGDEVADATEGAVMAGSKPRKAPAKKAGAKAKAKAPAKKPGGAKRTRPQVADDAVLTKADKLPPRAGKAMRERFAKYRNGLTVAATEEKLGIPKSAIRFDLARGSITAAA